MMMKRILALLLVLTLVVSCLPVSVFAEKPAFTHN